MKLKGGRLVLTGLIILVIFYLIDSRGFIIRKIFGPSPHFSTCHTYASLGIKLNCNAETFWQKYRHQSKFHCLAPARLGTPNFDGGWNLCLDTLHTRATPCLVYSFGIGNDSSFDFAIASFGCEVMMFDPTIPGENDQIVAKNIRFWSVGLGTSDADNRNSQGWKVSTLDSIARTLGHADSHISVLKMDIEGGEWNILPILFQSPWFREGRVGQILIEAHFTQDRALEQIAILGRLEELGYHIFAMDENWRFSGIIRVNGNDFLDCLEISFVYTGKSAQSNLMLPTNAYWLREHQRR